MINPVYVNEPCPLEGYENLSVRVLANSTDRAWQTWCAGNLGQPGCAKCASLNAPKVPRGRKVVQDFAPNPHAYCPACQAARDAYGLSIVLFYGPELLGHDVSTPEAALNLFDRDDALPSEIVIWLQLIPSAVRQKRQESLLGNLISS